MIKQQQQRQHDVLITGGGIAGLATAIALQRSDIDYNVRLIEASSEDDFLHVPTGAAAHLTPNGLRALRMLGGEHLLQQVLAHSSTHQRNVMVLPSKAKPYDNLMELPKNPCSIDNLPTVMIRWGLLRQFLAENIPANSISFDQRVSGPQKDKFGNISLSVQNSSNGSEVRLPVARNTLLVAADGTESSFRPTPLKKSGRVNVKAVVAAAAPLPEADKSTYLLFSPTGLGCFIGPAGAGWTYWGISVPVATLEDEAAFTLSGNRSTRRIELEAIKTKLLHTLQSSNLAETTVYVDLIRATPAEEIFIEVSVEADLPESLHDDGRIALVGDAAHAMPSSYGQSISFALEDAATLAHCLSDTNHETMLASLEMYSQLRCGRCLELQEKSRVRAAKAMKGEPTDDITNWIHDWDLKTTKVDPPSPLGTTSEEILLVG